MTHMPHVPRLAQLARHALLALWLALGGMQGAWAQQTVTFASTDGALQLTGQWFAADSAPGAGPRPAVLALHGCNGMLDDKGHLSGVWRRYAGYFNAERMHMLALDSFSPRGLQSICEVPNARRSVAEEDRRADAFAALRWLAQQPGVDATRIVVVGWSHGAQTVLSVLDASDKAVQAQLQPPAPRFRAAVAFYPGCQKFGKMWSYEISAPLLVMIGELDDWTPAAPCVALGEQLRKPGRQPFELTVYPGSYHAFDGTSPVTLRHNVGNSRSGTAMAGGNPLAREQSHARLFDFLSAQLGQPLVLSHEQRSKGHQFQVPPATGFAQIGDALAVPVSEAGRARYAHYLSLPVPKAFVVTEKGGWYFGQGEGAAMRTALQACKQVRCWLYAVDDQVVWSAEPAARVGADQLRRAAAP